jgi:hypothetical protein
VKKALHISLSILLSTIILVSGSGLTIGKMVCLKSGHKIISAKEAKDCCTDGINTASIKDQCCDVSNFNFHPNNFLVSGNFTLKSPAAVQLFLSAENFQSALISAISPQAIFASNDPPSLDRNSSISLPFSGVFRI